KKIKTIYTYISKHPYCKNPVISEKTKIPIGTVNRILAQLKDEGLIEYVGSKKTGGYRVKEETRKESANDGTR
ncbi:MAG: winged helix-turn-helix transcriptional regulator, partial [Bacteroidales bacterium]|nr:winged helix-turn-helix transcriptional regulator [Bacteroidales bacterium]